MGKCGRTCRKALSSLHYFPISTFFKWFRVHMARIKRAHTQAQEKRQCIARANEQEVVMNTCPRMDPDGGCDPFLTVEENGKVRRGGRCGVG